MRRTKTEIRPTFQNIFFTQLRSASSSFIGVGEFKTEYDRLGCEMAEFGNVNKLYAGNYNGCDILTLLMIYHDTAVRLNVFHSQDEENSLQIIEKLVRVAQLEPRERLECLKKELEEWKKLYLEAAPHPSSSTTQAYNTKKLEIAAEDARRLQATALRNSVATNPDAKRLQEEQLEQTRSSLNERRYQKQQEEETRKAPQHQPRFL